MVPPPIRNTEEVYYTITLVILYYNNYRLVTLLKVFVDPLQVSDTFDLIVSFTFINLCFQILRQFLS